MAELEQQQEEEIVTVALNPRAWIGVTVLISFAMSTLMVVMYLLSGGGQNLIQRKVALHTYFADGSGLEKKAIVKLDGIKIGKVQSVELSHSNEPTRVVRVNILIDRRYLESIPVDSQTELTEDNLLGDKYVNIHKGTAGEFIKAGDELFAKPPSGSFDPADLAASLIKVLDQVNSILDDIDNPETQLGQLVQGEALYDQIRDDIVGMQRTVHQFGNPKSPAGQAVFGTELYDQLRQPILDIDKQLTAIQSGEGPLGHAYASTEQYDKVRKQIGDFRKTVEELRKNKLLTSDETYTTLLQTFRNLNVVVTSLSKGPMFENAQLYESLEGSSKSAEKLLKDFRNNPQKYLRIKVF
jgi:phospholipid/cholesterol/gamma-HCH transport system substrate-binding protein